MEKQGRFGESMVIGRAILIHPSHRSRSHHHDEYGNRRIAEINLIGDLDEYAYIEVLTTRNEVEVRSFLRNENPHAVFAFYKKHGFTDNSFGAISKRVDQ